VRGLGEGSGPGQGTGAVEGDRDLEDRVGDSSIPGSQDPGIHISGPQVHDGQSSGSHATLDYKALDVLDWKLLHEITDDALRPLEDMAQDLGCAVSEVRERLGRLRQLGIVREIRARLDPAAMGFPVLAYLMVRMVQNADNYDVVRDMFSEIDQVEEAHSLSGQFDWLVKVRARTMQDLRQVITRRFSIVPGFVRAETLMVLDTACERVNIEAACHPPDPRLASPDHEAGAH